MKIVREKAFTPKEARVTGRGELVPGKSQLRITGTNNLYDLTGARSAELAKSSSKSVLIDGVIPAPKDNTYLKAIEVKSFKTAP